MATPFRLKRSSVTGKRPSLTDLQIGELAFNSTMVIYSQRETLAVVGIGTTVALLTPWKETLVVGQLLMLES